LQFFEIYEYNLLAVKIYSVLIILTMIKLPSRKTFRTISLILSPILLVTALVSSFGLLFAVNNSEFALQLAENSPQSIPHYIEYSLYRQAPPEGQVLGESITALDGKTALLRQYLEWQKSPLAPHAQTFIDVAEKYNLPWTLLPAICGKESTFGKNIPSNSHNCWGWGIYGSQVLRFENWDEGIDKVGKGIRENYFDKGLDTVAEIEYSYTPPSAYNPDPNKRHAWRDGVEFFQWEISQFSKL